MNNKSLILLILIIFLSLFFIFVFPFIGMTEISINSILNEAVSSRIFFDIRIPRVLTAFITGAVLALSGMMFQSLFKNDLATPYTLGISSGAALGAVTAIKFLSFLHIPFLSTVQVFSFFGAIATVSIIYFSTRTKKRYTTQLLLLAGVAVNFTCTGLILFIQYIATGSESSQMIHWMMGCLDIAGYSSLLKMLPAFILIFFSSVYLHRDLDLLRIDSSIAESRGVNIEKVKNIIFFTVSFSVATIVSETGPIGFVGMIAPHIGRSLIGKEHKFLIPSSLFIGGSLLLVSDTIARTVIAPSEIPVGVLTALAGGPFFMFILIRKKD